MDATLHAGGCRTTTPWWLERWATDRVWLLQACGCYLWLLPVAAACGCCLCDIARGYCYAGGNCETPVATAREQATQMRRLWLERWVTDWSKYG